MKNKPFIQTTFSSYSYKDFYKDIENEVEIFIAQFKDLCDKAGIEGWLGSPTKRDHKGLLGYMRISFAKQLKAINNLTFDIPCYFNNDDICNFFRSDFLANEAKKNGYVKPIYKKTHFDFLKHEAKNFKQNHTFSIEETMEKIKNEIQENIKLNEEYNSFDDIDILIN
jgi:hypothetical protein